MPDLRVVNVGGAETILEEATVQSLRSAERVLARQHQAQSISNAPGCRLAHPNCLGQANGRQSLVRLQISHNALSQMLSGSFVACSGVRVVAVN